MAEWIVYKMKIDGKFRYGTIPELAEKTNYAESTLRTAVSRKTGAFEIEPYQIKRYNVYQNGELLKTTVKYSELTELMTKSEADRIISGINSRKGIKVKEIWVQYTGHTN